MKINNKNLESSADKKVSYNSNPNSNTINNKLHLNMNALHRANSQVRSEAESHVYNVKNSFRPTINNSMIIDEDEEEEFDNFNFENNKIAFENLINAFIDEDIKGIHNTSLMVHEINSDNLKSEYDIDKNHKIIYIKSKLSVSLADLVDCLFDLSNVQAFDKNIQFTN